MSHLIIFFREVCSYSTYIKPLNKYYNKDFIINSTSLSSFIPNGVRSYNTLRERTTKANLAMEANLDSYLSLVTQENETSVEIKYFDNKPRILSR